MPEVRIMMSGLDKLWSGKQEYSTPPHSYSKTLRGLGSSWLLFFGVFVCGLRLAWNPFRVLRMNI